MESKLLFLIKIKLCNAVGTYYPWWLTTKDQPEEPLQ